MDPLGVRAPMGVSPGCDWIRSIDRVFRDRYGEVNYRFAQVATSELKVQRGSSMGCSFFILHNLFHMIHMPEYLAEVVGGDYADMPSDDRLWHYLKQHTTHANTEAMESPAFQGYSAPSETKYIFYPLDYVIPPLVFSLMKQTFGSDGRLEYVYHELHTIKKHPVKAWYSQVPIDLPIDPFVFGNVGLDLERRMIRGNWPDRVAEQDLPVSIFTRVTANEMIDRYTEKTVLQGADGKTITLRRNIMMVTKASEWREALVQHMLSLSPQEVRAIQEQFRAKALLDREDAKRSLQERLSAPLIPQGFFAHSGEKEELRIVEWQGEVHRVANDLSKTAAP